MEITKEMKEKLLKVNSEEEVKAILGDEVTQEEAAFVWERVQVKKAEGLEAVDDEELEAVSGGALWCLFGGEYSEDGKEVGCIITSYTNWEEAKRLYCPKSEKGHDWEMVREFREGHHFYAERKCRLCGYRNKYVND